MVILSLNNDKARLLFQMNVMENQDKIKKRSGLSLIDFGLSPSPKIIRGAEFHERIMWMIHLRWLAVIGLIIGLPAGQFLMGVTLLTPPLLILTCILCLHNLLSHILTRHIITDNDLGHLISANTQISVDILLLTLFIHFSGGFENPFIVSYVYYMIIAAILLTVKTAYLQALWASILLGAQTSLTQLGIVEQPHIDGFLRLSLIHETKYIWTFYVILVCTLFLVVYMTFSISKELKAREERLEKTNEMLLEKDKLKSACVLALSHDLKQPLAAAQTNLRVILDGYAGEVTQKAYSMIEKAEHRLIQLLNIIQDLLSLFKVTSTQITEKFKINLVKLVHEISELAEVLAADRNQEFEILIPDQEIFVIANYETLSHTIWNLVDNAIKYTPEGGRVSLRVFEENKHIVFIVEDTGIGIPPNEIESVFGDFYRAKNAVDWDKHGTGLGLAIVKHAVEIHGWQIEIISPRPDLTSNETPGTRIKVSIPINVT